MQLDKAGGLASSVELLKISSNGEAKYKQNDGGNNPKVACEPPCVSDWTYTVVSSNKKRIDLKNWAQKEAGCVRKLRTLPNTSHNVSAIIVELPWVGV